jgi:hypothetical protein
MTDPAKSKKISKQVARLVKTLRLEFAEWLEGSVQRELFWDEPQQILNADALLTWHLTHYAHAVLTEQRYPLEELALAARHADAALKFDEAFADRRKGGGMLITSAAHYFALNIIAGWRSEADGIGKALYKGLDTPLLDLRHTDRHEKGSLFRHFWFLMHLYCALSGLPLQTSQYSYPADMAPYGAVIDGFRTTDLRKVHDWVCAMADFHVENARELVDAGGVPEFELEDYRLFPYEILAFLRMREWLDLPNPEAFDHPLMQQPLAKLPAPVPLPYPSTPLLDQVILKFSREFPGRFT